MRSGLVRHWTAEGFIIPIYNLSLISLSHVYFLRFWKPDMYHHITLWLLTISPRSEITETPVFVSGYFKYEGDDDRELKQCSQQFFLAGWWFQVIVAFDIATNFIHWVWIACFIHLLLYDWEDYLLSLSNAAYHFLLMTSRSRCNRSIYLMLILHLWFVKIRGLCSCYSMPNSPKLPSALFPAPRPFNSAATCVYDLILFPCIDACTIFIFQILHQNSQSIVQPT